MPTVKTCRSRKSGGLNLTPDRTLGLRTTGSGSSSEAMIRKSLISHVESDARSSLSTSVDSSHNTDISDTKENFQPHSQV